MDKKLEEAINWLKSNIKYYKEQIEFIKATDCDYYEEQSLYEKRIKIFENILNYIDNSISKEVIKEKIEEVRKMKFEDERLNGATIDFAACKFEEILEGK